MLKKQCKFKLLKEVTLNWLRIWYFDLVLWPPRCYSSAKTIVVTELKSTLRNSSHISASSRRPEDVKMLRVASFTERGRMLRILLGLQIIHSLCFAWRMLLFWRPRRRACRVVDLKFPIVNTWHKVEMSELGQLWRLFAIVFAFLCHFWA